MGIPSSLIGVLVNPPSLMKIRAGVASGDTLTPYGVLTKSPPLMGIPAGGGASGETLIPDGVLANPPSLIGIREAS